MEYTFYIKVTPGAKQSRFKIENDQIKVYLQAPAVEGKANDALISFISNNLCIIEPATGKAFLAEQPQDMDLFTAQKVHKIKKGQITITKGLKLRTKTISILT